MGILRKRTIFLLLLVLPLLAQVRTGAIAVFGNEKVPEWKIVRLMQTREASWYKKILSQEPYFNSRQLDSDLKVIRNYYRDLGYLDIQVRASAHHDKKEDIMDINVFIEEGKRYFLQEIIIDIQDTSDFLINKIKAEISSEEKDPVNPGKLNKDSRSIANLLKNNGYPFSTVSQTIEKKETGFVLVKFEIEFGKRAYFGDVHYRGLNVTDTSVVKREVDFEKGEEFSARKVSKTRQALYATGLFSLVSVEINNRESQAETLDYKITVVERKSRWFGAQIGVSSGEEYDLAPEAAVSWGHRNLFGTGREISTEASSKWSIMPSINNLKNRLEMSYREPWAFGTRIPVVFNVYFEPGNSEKIPQYVIQLIGFNIRAEQQITTNSNHSVYFDYHRADIYDVKNPIIEAEILGENEILITRKLGYSGVIDRRDNILVPTSGSYMSWLTEFAGYFLGGDEHYSKANFNYSRYFTIRSRYIFATRVRTAGIGNWKSGEDVLPHQRYYLGGANSIRGWEERSIGPKLDDGTPLGGKFLLLGNVEFRTPLIWHFWGHAFFDTGNLWSHAEAFNPADIKASAGWGLALITPVGPIRFDYGYQIINPEEEGYGESVKNSNWHISLMYSF